MTTVATISQLDAADTPNITDGTRFEVEDANGDSKYAELYQIRTGLGGVVATGDVTFSGALGTSFATTIAADAVTLAKSAHGTANRLMGYDGTGIPVEVNAGSGITISGGTLSASAPAASAPRATLYLAEEYAL